MGTKKKSRRRGVITETQLAKLQPGQSLSDPAPRGAGTLQARKLKDGTVAFYFRYTDASGKRDRLPLGLGCLLAEARARAFELSVRMQNTRGSFRDELKAEDRERERQALAAKLEEEARSAAANATLGALLKAYVASLEGRQAASSKSVRRSLDRNVKDAWPVLWDKPANAVTTSDLVQVIGRLAEQGKDREASKLRSYFVAAFRTGITASQNPKASQQIRDLKITHNPAADVLTVLGANKTKDRALSDAELRSYWAAISSSNDAKSCALRFHLLTGAQRLEQLRRVTYSDVDTDSQSLRIWDSKGRRAKPREHRVPLISEAIEAMEGMGKQLGPYCFTLTNGRTGASVSAISRGVAAVSDQLRAEGKAPGGRFGPGDLRRTVETALARHGVSKDIRGQLQSHGLGSVQDRHYDRHDYLREKRAALELLRSILLHGKLSGV